MEYLPISLRAPRKHAVRNKKEKRHPYRSEFERDRDRIMYCKAFRRLSSKTQIFITSFDDHARNRLTHTLEVAQISRTISDKLKLDSNLAEAIALGHDLGHTPFGHVGERTLNLIMNNCDSITRDYCLGNNFELHEEDRGFKHNLQSVRVVTDLGSPLNLTNYTLFGLWHHSSVKCKPCEDGDKTQCLLYPKAHNCSTNQNLSVGYYSKYSSYMKLLQDTPSWSFESYVVAQADEIAQRHHDVEDALEGKLITPTEVVNLIKKHFGEYIDSSRVDKSNFKILNKSVVNSEDFSRGLSRFVVNFLVNRLLAASSTNLATFIKKYKVKSHADYVKLYPNFNLEEVKEYINFENQFTSSDKFNNAHKAFQDELRKLVLNAHSVQRMDGKARYIIRRIFKAYLSNPQQLPDKTIFSLFKEYNPKSISSQNFKLSIGQLRDYLNFLHRLSDQTTDQKESKKKCYFTDQIDDPVKFRKSLLRVICDYVSGMTDSYAIRDHENLYG